MIINLFSIFDPSTNILDLSINWLRIFLGILVIPASFWLIPNNIYIFYSKILITLYFEFKTINNNKNNKIIIIFISLFIFILIRNFIRLFPYIFTRTRHLVLNLSIALPLWLSFILYGWFKKTNYIFTHLVPQGTPIILIPFIVLIETIRNIIRPITLIIRLTANIIAGHLLITLLGNIGPSIFILLTPILLTIQILLLLLESAVAIIQSYVFSVLITLYYREI